MGNRDSKPCFITYEDAIKRVTDGELKRLKETFKRSSTLGGYMTKPVFIREVLGDGVPARLAEQMYVAFGGTTKGLAFKDLICGLVLLTRGRQEEKVKFLFGLYANESLSHVQKEEMDRLVLATEGQVPQALSDLFLETDRVTYEYFRSWVLMHSDSTSVTRWLLQEPCSVTLSNDLETPTFYQTLAGVTHYEHHIGDDDRARAFKHLNTEEVEETDIIELEKRYWVLKAQSRTGRFDLETFKPIVSPPIPDALVEGVFNAFDENRDNHIDFKEMACGISACCRGPMTERQKFCFKIFDTDLDGLLSHSELENMLTAMLIVRKENKMHDLSPDGLEDLDPKKLSSEIIHIHDSDKDGCITQEEYLVWTVSHHLPSVFLDLLFQVCHVVLGLKPQTKDDEGQVISGWVEREERNGLKVNQTWYMVSITWWRQWLEYVNIRSLDVSMNGNGNSNGYRDSPSKRGHSRTSSLCRNLGRKSSIGLEDTGGIVGTSYSTLPSGGSGSDPMVTAGVYATLPRTSPSPQGSPLKANLSSGDVTNSPMHSRNNTPSPNPSPQLAKRQMGSFAAPKPGAVDNTPLIYPNTQKVMMLTNEGGRLKRDKMLIRGRDFEILPEPVWKALSAWYGGSPALPRTVIIPSDGDGKPELELYPISVRLLRHQAQPARPTQTTTFTGMIGGMGGMAMSTAGLTAATQPPTPRRYLAYMAAFSRKHSLRQVYDFLTSRLRIGREDMRLWKFKDEHNMTLLEEEDMTMEQLGIEESQQLLIEVRNKDQTWPEEMSMLAKTKASIDKKVQVPTERGATGLNNLGNTCFMNSALQCVSNTRILTLYFTGGMHLYEINRLNPLGMKGHVAQRYGDLVKDLWSGTVKSIAPLKLRWTIGKYAPRFNGFQQHDSQELLAFLLDGLHEDLNRVHDKPYVELKDSDGRADEIVAKEAWDNHLRRNRSVIVDLFHGQLKSQVRCMECGHTSVRFDPFTYLSLPLPMDSCIHLEIIVMRLDGSVPIKYGIRLNMDEKYRTLKKTLSDLSGIPAPQLLLVEIFGALVKSLPQDSQKIRSLLGGSLYAYELPPMPEIQPMTVLEEKGLSPLHTKGQCGLNQIQRMHTKHSVMLCDNLPPVNQTISEQHNGDTPTVNGSPGNNNNNYFPSANSSSPAGQSAGGTASRSDSPLVNGLSNGSSGSSQGSPALSNHQGEPSNSTAVSPTSVASEIFTGFVVAVHRKMIRMDVYFLSSQKSRPSLFGTPLILPVDERTRQQDLYHLVWAQVSRLVSPLPPSESSTSNHAQDCDDSLGYEYPFALKVVQKDGFTCAWCPWYRFCRGCKLECNTEDFNFGSCFIAVDWEPTALHLRYQTSQERLYEDHPSVEESRRLQTEPIDLDACLKAFTKEEELGEDELYYCSKCKKHCLAAKKLELWRLPPILIIHLKRFQFLNGRWVKSQKIVKFPMHHFDPTNYLVKRMPRGSLMIQDGPAKLETTNGATNHNTNAGHMSGEPQPGSLGLVNKPGVPAMNGEATQIGDKPSPRPNHVIQSPGVARKAEDITLQDRVSQAREAMEEVVLSEDPSLSTSVISLDSVTSEDYAHIRYNLCAMSCHTGILGGGHYVAYAKNPNDKWYFYNDSSCKEVNESQVDTDSAYMLFFERSSLDYGRFMPDISGKEPDTSEIDDEFESDFKKLCVIQ